MQVHIGEMLEGRFSAVGEASLKLCPRKVKKRKGACTNRARVPAESARNGKVQVQTGRLYLRKYGCLKVWVQFRQTHTLRGRKNPSDTYEGFSRTKRTTLTFPSISVDTISKPHFSV